MVMVNDLNGLERGRQRWRRWLGCGTGMVEGKRRD
jgi:hypothetical protein